MTATRPNPVSTPKRLALPRDGHLPSFVVIDLQTTGVSPDRHEIIQIAAARINADGSVSAHLSTYVRPCNYVPQDITTLTGICDADLADAPTAPEALRTLARFVADPAEDATGDLMIVTLKGHIPFIAAACARHALPVRPVRFIDPFWFFHDFFYMFSFQLTIFPDEADQTDMFDPTGMGISTVMANPADVVSAIKEWLGID
ncbi:MAG TPA: 3'-5' exonuclease, partial [Rariglobus sp.]